MSKFLPLLICGLCFIVAHTANAQQPAGQGNYDPNRDIDIGEITKYNPYNILEEQTHYSLYYDRKVRELEALPELYPGYSLGRLTDAYIHSAHYDPEAVETIDRLYALAFAAQKEDTPLKTRMRAINDFQTTLRSHLANLDIVNTGINLMRLNDTLEGEIINLRFLNWIKDGLIRRLTHSGTGDTIREAYRIISNGEEAYILALRNFKIIQTEDLFARGDYYHIHLVEDRDTGRPWKIYTNVTAPLEHQKRINALQNPHPIYDDYRPSP